MTGISGANFKGIKVNRGAELDLILFRIGDSRSSLSNSGWTVNASSMTITRKGANVETLAGSNAISVLGRNGTYFAASDPVSFAITYGDIITAIVNSNTNTQISFFTGSRPTSVSMDGQPLPASDFTYDAAKMLVTLNKTIGQHKIILAIK